MTGRGQPVKAPLRGTEPKYDAGYYRHSCGTPYERNAHWLSFFDGVAGGIVDELSPTSVLDAGCAMGFLVEALDHRGVDARGVDISEYAISQVDPSVRDRCSVASLTVPLERFYDLITCIEVLEHVPPFATGPVIANLCGATDRILLSTTPEDYGEATHLNVRPPEDWSAALASEGFFRDPNRDFSFITPWAALYTRRKEPQEETVRRYEQMIRLQRSEVTELRQMLLATTNAIERHEAETGDCLKDLEGRDEELDRLRRLLIEKDAELASTLGTATSLERQMRHLPSIRVGRWRLG